MIGGLLQLVAKGNDNLFLTDNPEITLFKRIYRRHTDFSISHQKLNFNKKIPFGGQGQCTIKKNGDLVHKLMLFIDIPAVQLKYIKVANKTIASILKTYDITYEFESNIAKTIVTSLVYTTNILPLIENKVNELVEQINNSQSVINLLNINSTRTTPQNLIDIITQNTNESVLSFKKNTWQTTYDALYSYYNNALTIAQTTYNLINPTLNLNNTYESSGLDTLLLSMINNSDPNFAWVKYLGYFIIDTISLSINDEIIDSHTGEFMYIYNHINYNVEHTRGTNICMGNVESLYTFNNEQKQSYRLMIPINFWCCQDIAMSIPLCKLQYSDVMLTLKLNSLDKIAYWDKLSVFVKKPVVNVSLMAEYIYIDKEERQLLCESKIDQLINVVQYVGDIYFNSNDIDETSNKIEHEFSFDNMCTEILWFIQPPDNIDGSLNNKEIRPWDFMYKTGVSSTNKLIATYNDSSYSLSNITTSKDVKINPFDTIAIKLNSRVRENPKGHVFYDSVVPVIKRKASGIDGLMDYCFNINPTWSIQPSGAINLSKAYQFSLEATLNDTFQSSMMNSKKQFRWGVYAIKKNHLRIMSGLAGKIFL